MELTVVIAVGHARRRRVPKPSARNGYGNAPQAEQVPCLRVQDPTATDKALQRSALPNPFRWERCANRARRVRRSLPDSSTGGTHYTAARLRHDREARAQRSSCDDVDRPLGVDNRRSCDN